MFTINIIYLNNWTDLFVEVIIMLKDRLSF